MRQDYRWICRLPVRITLDAGRVIDVQHRNDLSVGSIPVPDPSHLAVR
jgi:hypothetical protein